MNAPVQPPQHFWMQTYTGQAFDPMNPDPERIKIEDIAHALAMNCRYAGHVNRFYSVAEHSVHVSRNVSRTNALWGLLHDASEAYIADIVRPVKKRMPEYKLVEDVLMAAICRRFHLPVEQPAEIYDIDLRIVVDEKAVLLNKEPLPWGAIEGLEPVGATISAWSPERAKGEFLETFQALYSVWS